MWEPSSANIASVTVTSDLLIIEISERRRISAMSVKNNNIIPPPTESSHDLMLDDDTAAGNPIAQVINLGHSERGFTKVNGKTDIR